MFDQWSFIGILARKQRQSCRHRQLPSPPCSNLDKFQDCVALFFFLSSHLTTRSVPLLCAIATSTSSLDDVASLFRVNVVLLAFSPSPPPRTRTSRNVLVRYLLLCRVPLCLIYFHLVEFLVCHRVVRLVIPSPDLANYN